MRLERQIFKGVLGTSAAADLIKHTIAIENSIEESAIYVEWEAGVTAGSVVIETAARPDYPNAWIPIATLNWSAANRQDVVQHTGAYGAIRLRYTGVVGGGGISAYLFA